MKWVALVIAFTIVGLGRPSEACFTNYTLREINCKIVYDGSETAPLHENLVYIYGKTNPEGHGKLIALSTETERTEFFDFLPLSLGEIRGFKVRFHLYTVPTKPGYDVSRLLILKGVDGVVFVADSDRAKASATVASWEQLKKNLAHHNYNWQSMPLVVQLAHRDLPNAITLAELRPLLRLTTQPMFNATVPDGVGVFDTLKAIAKLILVELKKG
jgi:signal recognition particle receptor subunit beta